MSSRSPAATSALTLPVAWSYTGKVLPEAAGIHLPSMSNFLGEPRNRLTGWVNE